MQITITNGTLTNIQETLSPAQGYTLPSSVVVTGATSSYSDSAGVLQLTSPTSSMSVSASGVAAVTPSIGIGNLPIDNMYFGTLQVKKIYLGNILVWESAAEPIPENALLAQDGALFTNDNGYLITTEVTMITFNVVNASYQAEEGMTWTEWVASEYNTNGYILDNSKICTANGLYMVMGIVPSDVILANTTYRHTSNVSGGAND